MRRLGGIVASALTVATLLGACAQGNDGGDGAARTEEPPAVPLNALQYVGTHNSYHVAPAPEVLEFLSAAAAAIPGAAEALGDPASLDYTHPTLTEQLDAGIRTFELDVMADPDGGRFLRPSLIDSGFVTLDDPGLPEGLERPGFKVIHIPDIDWGTTCGSLIACFGEISTWSDANPGHLPIIINVELKSSGLPDGLPRTEVLPVDGPLLDAFDAEARELLGDRLLTPDDVRGDAADLRTALADRGWPTLDEVRGRVLLFMDNADLRETYLEGHPGLRGRVLFTSSGEGEPDGAILKLNDATEDERIRRLVAEGYLIRTRADGDVTRTRADLAAAEALRDRALGSGAQVVHTDFPVGAAAPNGYVVDLERPVQVRCSPVQVDGVTCRDDLVVE